MKKPAAVSPAPSAAVEPKLLDFDKVSTELGTLYTAQALHEKLPYVDLETARQLTAENTMPHYKVRGLSEPLYDIQEIKSWATKNLIEHEKGENLLLGVAPTSISQISGLRQLGLDGTSGVYFLCYKGVVVYVGESENVFKRSSDHRDKPHDETFYLLVSELQRKKLEKDFIRRLNPKHNLTHKSDEAPSAAQVLTSKSPGLSYAVKQELKKQNAAVAA